MYIELHARSAFSFLEGASIPEEFTAWCVEHEMPAMALLDRDGVYGSPRFYLAGKKAGITAHVGGEVTSPEGWRYTVLAESRAGYQNLCRLVTRMKLRAKNGEGSVQEEEVAKHASGLGCLSGGEEGPLAYALAHGGIAAGIQALQQLTDIFRRSRIFASELQRHLSRDEEARNQAAIEIARKLHLPLLATNGVCHAQPAQRKVLDVFTCIRHHRALATAGRLLSRNAERHMKTAVEMKWLCLPICRKRSLRPVRALFAAAVFAGRSGLPVSGVSGAGGRFGNEFSAAANLGRNDFALQERTTRKPKAQINRELELIEKLDLPGYFLIVWDIVRFCREKNILVQGRGSAANSAVCYSLGITAVDPVGMDLLFERFLSEERGEWPDIDLDLPSGGPTEAGDSIRLRALRQTGCGDDRERDHLPRQIGGAGNRQSAFVQSGNAEPSLQPGGVLGVQGCERHAGPAIPRCRAGSAAPPGKEIFRTVPFGSVIYPATWGSIPGEGMVVSPGLVGFGGAAGTGVDYAWKGGGAVGQRRLRGHMGIVKVDLLGLGMMAVLEESLAIIHEHYGEEVDLSHLPADDPKVYAALQKADTVGLFQIESRAGMSCLPAAAAYGVFADICVVQVAIIRPGPNRREKCRSSLPAPPPGTRKAGMFAPIARAGTDAHPGRASFPGTVVAHGYDRGGIYRWPGRGIAAGVRVQAFGSTDEGRGNQTARGHERQRNHRSDAGSDHPVDHFVRSCTARFPGIAMRQVLR